MKRKIIQAFLAIYLVVSMAYSGIRTAYITVKAAIAPSETAEQQTEQASASFGFDAVPAEPELVSASMPSPVIQAEDIPEDMPQASEETPVSSPEEAAAADVPEEVPDEESALEETAPEEAVSEEAVPEEVSAFEEAPETSEDSEEAEASIEEAPAEDVPSLEEYLSTLHCGRCGRNCYLSNPRCRTGRRKAETETTAYYELYGSSDEI